MAKEYEWFDCILCTFIFGVLILEHRGHRFPIGWGEILMGMLARERIYAWGPCLLAMLYFKLHDIAYKDGYSMSYGVTLLMV